MVKIRSRPLKFEGKGIKAQSQYQKTVKSKLIKAAVQEREQTFQQAQKRAKVARHEKQFKLKPKTKTTIVTPSAIVPTVGVQPLQPLNPRVIDITPRGVIVQPIRVVKVPGVAAPLQLNAPAINPLIIARRALAQKRAAKKTGKQKSTEALQKGRVRNWLATASFSRPFSSSWVDGIGYDQESQTLAAQLSGVVYAWAPVDYVIYQAWWSGAAMCVTNDPTGQNRWRKGKTPSLGAMWHHGGIARKLQAATRVM